MRNSSRRIAGTSIRVSGDEKRDGIDEGISCRPGVPEIARKRFFAAGDVLEVRMSDDFKSRRLI